MGKDTGEVRNMIMGTQLAYEVAGRINVGNNWGETSTGGAGEERGVSVGGMRGMDPYNGIHFDQAFDFGRMLTPDHEPADGWHRYGDSEGGRTCLCASCDLGRIQNWDSAGKS